MQYMKMNQRDENHLERKKLRGRNTQYCVFICEIGASSCFLKKTKLKPNKDSVQFSRSVVSDSLRPHES